MGEELRLLGLKESLVVSFVNEANSRDITTGQLFEEREFLYHLFDFDFTSEEIESLKRVKDVLPKILAKKLRVNINTTMKRIDGLGSKEVIVGSRNSTNSGFLRIKTIVDEMMKTNDEAKEWYDKRFLNQKSIFDHGQKAKQLDDNKMGVGVNSIKQYLAVNKVSIEEHHKKHDLLNGHNLKAHHHRMNEKRKNNIEITY